MKESLRKAIDYDYKQAVKWLNEYPKNQQDLPIPPLSLVERFCLVWEELESKR